MRGDDSTRSARFYHLGAGFYAKTDGMASISMIRGKRRGFVTKTHRFAPKGQETATWCKKWRPIDKTRGFAPKGQEIGARCEKWRFV